MISFCHKIVCIFALICLITTAFPAHQIHAQKSDEQELFLVAQKAFEDGFYDVAMRYINQLFEEFPNTEKQIQAKLLLGQCYFFKSQYLKAHDVFKDLLEFSEFKDATLFWLGETYLKGSDYINAKKQYEQLISLYPESIYTPQAYYSLGWSYFAQNNYEEAKNAFLKLIRKHPVHQLTEDASFKLAETEYNLGEYEKAIQFFKSYVLNHPKSRRHAQAYYYIAEAYYFLENFLTAVTFYAKSAEMAYDNKLILMSKVNLGWSYLKLEKLKLAQQYFDESYQFAKEKGILSDDVYLGQATFYAETGDHNKALKAYKKLIDNFPGSERIIEAYLGLANTHYQMKQYKQAIRNYREIIDRTENDTTRNTILEKAYFGLAWAHLKSGDVDSAVEAFQTIKKTTANKTVRISAMTQIGDAYQDVGQYDKAVSFYDQILKDFPESLYTDYVQYRQGIALLKMDKIEAATLSFQSLQTNFPTSKYLNDVNYYLAVAYFKKEDWITAKERITQFISDLPSANKFLAEAHYILALSNYNLHQYKEALHTFHVILKDHAQESSLVKNAQLYIAKCYYAMGDTSQALTKFQGIVKEHPKSKTAQESLMWLGDHHLGASEFEEAVVYYKQFIKLFPGSSKLSLIIFELGRAYQALKQYDQAVKTFQRIDKSENPDLYEKARLSIADIFSEGLDSESAIQTYQNIVDTSPEFRRSAYIKIAQIYAKTRNFEKSVEAYQNALESKADNSEVSNAELQYLIADGYQQANQHDRAVEEYLKVSYLYPNEAHWVIKSYLHMARIFEDDEQWEDAKITYTKILKFETDESKFAQERLDWIDEYFQK